MERKEYRDYIKTGNEPGKKKRNKYNAKSCKCAQDHIHDSIDEASCCNLLHNLIKDGEISTQKTFHLYVNDKKICGHRVDFLVTWEDGRQEVFEYKGFATGVWRIKHKLFEACYPDIPYHVVKKADLKRGIING